MADLFCFGLAYGAALFYSRWMMPAAAHLLMLAIVVFVGTRAGSRAAAPGGIPA